MGQSNSSSSTSKQETLLKPFDPTKGTPEIFTKISHFRHIAKFCGWDFRSALSLAAVNTTCRETVKQCYSHELWQGVFDNCLKTNRHMQSVLFRLITTRQTHLIWILKIFFTPTYNFYSVNHRFDFSGQQAATTLLHYAVRHQNRSLIKYAVDELKADVNTKTDHLELGHEITALDVAIRTFGQNEEYDEYIEWLLLNGVTSIDLGKGAAEKAQIVLPKLLSRSLKVVVVPQQQESTTTNLVEFENEKLAKVIVSSCSLSADSFDEPSMLHVILTAFRDAKLQFVVENTVDEVTTKLEDMFLEIIDLYFSARLEHHPQRHWSKVLQKRELTTVAFYSTATRTAVEFDLGFRVISRLLKHSRDINKKHFQTDKPFLFEVNRVGPLTISVNNKNTNAILGVVFNAIQLAIAKRKFEYVKLLVEEGGADLMWEFMYVAGGGEARLSPAKKLILYSFAETILDDSQQKKNNSEQGQEHEEEESRRILSFLEEKMVENSSSPMSQYDESEELKFRGQFPADDAPRIARIKPREMRMK